MLRDIDINDKCSIQIEQIIEGEEGSVVWDSGLVLLSYFNKNKEFVNAKKILELGSGKFIILFLNNIIIIRYRFCWSRTHSSWCIKYKSYR